MKIINSVSLSFAHVCMGRVLNLKYSCKGLTIWLSWGEGGGLGFYLKNILVLDMQEKNKMAHEWY